MRYGFRAFSLLGGRFWVFSQVSELWAHVDLNHGPHRCQRRVQNAVTRTFFELADRCDTVLTHT